MHRSDFHFDLPQALIAQHPLPERAASRLLCLDGVSGELRDAHMRDFPDLLAPDDLLVVNNVRVWPARLTATKPTGGQGEVLVERVESDTVALVHARFSKPLKPGGEVVLGGAATATMIDRDGALFRLALRDTSWPQLMQEHGSIPLPPYIERAADADDSERYQTVFAREPGAAAAPTAGLHFDRELLQRIADKGVQTAEVTLWVGAGTFQPVRADKLEDHVMHSERIDVPQATVDAVARTRAAGGRVVAVGTTTVRALESAARANNGVLAACQSNTSLFLTPGSRFHVVDALLTNFHLPESTLLMLVSAFSGHAHMMAAYRHAVAQAYRFFSYGDAMFLTPQPSARPVSATTTASDTTARPGSSASPVCRGAK